jgi:hypothetical protein
MGEIKRLALIYAEDTEEQAPIDLDEMRQHVRAERMAELLEDLTVACRDVLKARDSDATALRRVK